MPAAQLLRSAAITAVADCERMHIAAASLSHAALMENTTKVSAHSIYKYRKASEIISRYFSAAARCFGLGVAREARAA